VLVEAVLRSWSFEHEAPWQRQQYDQLTSPEALTLAVLPFTFVHEKIKGSVRTRLGALAGSVRRRRRLRGFGRPADLSGSSMVCPGLAATALLQLAMDHLSRCVGPP
jgi:hypothetical protein